MAKVSYATTSEWTFHTSVKYIDVTTTGPEPVRDWRYVDAAGHGHYYAPGYPTLTHVVDEWAADDDGEEYPVRTHMECPHCGEHITPETRYSMGRSTVPDVRLAWLERPGERIDLAPDEADELLGLLSPPNAGEVLARWVASRSGE